MLGRIQWGSSRKIVLREERVLGLSVLTVELPKTSRRWKRDVKKGAEMLRKKRAIRVLTPVDFSGWSILEREGLRPVETKMLRCMLAPDWVAVQLKRRNIPRERAVLCLKGDKREPALEQLSRELCPLVRSLVFDVPGGDEVADHLRREVGMPVLPSDFSEAHLTMWLDEGPVLAGAEITLSGRELPTDCDKVSLIGVLWETGRIKSEEIVLKV